MSTALFGPESLFANYLRDGIMMFFIISPILSSSLVRSLVNIGLAMGAVRKSLWSTMELAIAAQALVCLPILALLGGNAGAAFAANPGLALSLPVLAPWLVWVFLGWLRETPARGRAVNGVGLGMIIYFAVWGVWRNLAPLLGFC